MEQTVNNKRIKVIKIALIIFSVMAVLKMIMVEYNLDEEYQVMMSYRLLNGDKLYLNMFEPHQLSAFLGTAVMGLFHLVFRTYTGSLIFLRVVSALIQAAISIYIYKWFKRIVSDNAAFVAALTFLNISPKMIQSPDFSNMQVWFFVLMILPALSYFREGEKKKWWLLIISGIATALEVLSYPTLVVLTPVMIIYILVVSKKKLNDLALYLGGILVSAAIWCIVYLPGLGIMGLINGIKLSLSLDSSHINREISISSALTDALIVIALFVGINLISLMVSFILKKIKNTSYIKTYMFSAIIISLITQLVLWLVLKKGYEYCNIHLMTLLSIGFVIICVKKSELTRLFILPLIGTIVSYITVIISSNLAFYTNLSHLVLGAVISVVLICVLMEDNDDIKYQIEHAGWILAIIILVVLTTGKIATFRSGRDLKIITDIRNISYHGIAAGVITDYMTSYTYNSNYEDFRANVSDGDKVLVAAESTTLYSFKDVEICNYSLVNPAVFNENLLKYWEMFPEKRPNVIVVDCWFGNLNMPEDSFIMQYVENDLGYTKVVDGKYVRFYIRENEAD